MKNGNEEKSSQSSLDCDVGLGLKMQVHPSSTEPYYSCKRANTTTMAFPLYHSDSNANITSFSGDGHGGGGSILGQVAGGGPHLSPLTFHNSGLRPSRIGGGGGGMFVSEKGPFSGLQWQEFERQKIIQKYIMASVPVPPELLLPLSRTTTTSSLPLVSQSNISGLELRFGSSSRSDPEPWRCKRTDGKKWRCSRDVAPDQKYCERHAHKSRSRSRKPVEIPSSHINKSNNNTNYSHPAFIHLSTNSPPTTKQTTTTIHSQFPTMASSTTTYDQTRCIEWFMRGGSGTSNIPFSTCNQQQWQHQQFQTSSKYTDNNKNVSLYQPHDDQYQDNNNKQGNLMSPDSYALDNNNIIRHMLQNHHQPDNGMSLNPKKTQKTRHFIDAWEKEGKKNSESSLTLSMYAGGNEIDEEVNGNGNLGINWMNSFAPGGPLGEALCLGNASTTRGNSNLASPHGYSSNNSNTNSSGGCSKSYGEDGSHALNFIG